MAYGFGITQIASDILAKRYLYNGETVDELLTRVARYIAAAEEEDVREEVEENFIFIMRSGRFIPNSPCLVNAGKPNNPGGLFACFVIGMEDSLPSITFAKADAMMITKAGGGWGIGLSKLRPEGAIVASSTHGVAGGPIGFLETFSADMRTMTQGGFRDAACMATLSITHPDIIKFITAKSPQNALRRILSADRIFGSSSQAMIDKLLSDPVMSKVAETYLSNFNISVLVPSKFMAQAVSKEEYGLEFGGHVYGSLNAGAMLDQIAASAWKNGEPGILFIDTIRERTRYEPESINATNPCGEQALPPNGSCCLGSVNIAAHVIDGAIDYDMLSDTISVGVRFLDNMITMNTFPTRETQEWSLKHRAIGLGVMGLADALILMGIRYDSEQAVHISKTLGQFLLREATEESKKLQEERAISEDDTGWDYRRNHALLSIAPTGTISLLAGCSAGIEPIFRREVTRVDQTGTHIIVHPLADNPAFVSVDEIDPIWIIEHVSAWAQSVDNSISYTVNVKNSATIDDVKRLIIHAWQKKCNGITLYRDGSRKMQVLSSQDTKSEQRRRRPFMLSGKTVKYRGQIDGVTTNVYVTVNVDEFGTPWEVFIHTPQIRNMTELQLVTATSRMTSLALRNGIPILDIIRQLERIEGQALFSAPAILAKALKDTSTENGDICTMCGGVAIRASGCITCQSCGSSRCE